MRMEKGAAWEYFPDKLVHNRHDLLNYEQVYAWDQTQRELLEDLRGREEKLVRALAEEHKGLLDAYTSCLAALLARVADNTYYTGLITGIQRMYQAGGQWPLEK